MRRTVGILILTSALAMAPVAISLGGGHSGGTTNGSPAGMVSTELGNASEAAKAAYYSGLRSLKRGMGYDAEADKASAPEKSAQYHEKAKSAYRESLAPFIDAISIQRTLYQAWNGIGVADLRLGNFDDAVSAYTKALELKPNYPEAISGRAEAYLALNMIDEAKADYLALSSDSPKIAEALLPALRNWVNAHPQGAEDLTAAQVAAFAKWVSEGASNASPATR